MSEWNNVQIRKAEMRKETVAELTPEEQELLVKVLELEWENRHLKTHDIRLPLKKFIQQVIK